MGISEQQVPLGHGQWVPPDSRQHWAVGSTWYHQTVGTTWQWVAGTTGNQAPLSTSRNHQVAGSRHHRALGIMHLCQVPGTTGQHWTSLPDTGRYQALHIPTEH